MDKIKSTYKQLLEIFQKQPPKMKVMVVVIALLIPVTTVSLFYNASKDKNPKPDSGKVIEEENWYTFSDGKKLNITKLEKELQSKNPHWDDDKIKETVRLKIIKEEEFIIQQKLEAEATAEKEKEDAKKEAEKEAEKDKEPTDTPTENLPDKDNPVVDVPPKEETPVEKEEVFIETVKSTEDIDYAVINKKNQAKWYGYEEVIQAGVVGKKEITTTRTYENSKKEKMISEDTKEAILVEKKDQINEIGVKFGYSSTDSNNLLIEINTHRESLGLPAFKSVLEYESIAKQAAVEEYTDQGDLTVLTLSAKTYKEAFNKTKESTSLYTDESIKHVGIAMYHSDKGKERVWAIVFNKSAPENDQVEETPPNSISDSNNNE